MAHPADGRGPFRIDLHCHTAASFDAKTHPAEVAAVAAERGITHLLVTDHDTLEGALRARDAAPAGLTVIVGSEVHTADGDLICAFLDHALPEGLPLATAIAAARAQGAAIGLPHPFDPTRRSVLRDPERVEALLPVLATLDWVETWNGRVPQEADNAEAARLAARLGLPGVAVSDAHTLLEVGIAWTELTIEPLDAERLVRALATGVPSKAPTSRGTMGRWFGRLGRS